MMIVLNNRPIVLSLPAAARTLLLAIMAAAQLLLIDGERNPSGLAARIRGSQQAGWLPLAAPLPLAALLLIGSSFGAAY